MKITRFVLVNFVIPIIVGIVVANLGIVGCVFYGHFLKYTPCWIINFIIAALLTAIVLDLAIYVALPRIKSKRTKNNAAIEKPEITFGPSDERGEFEYQDGKMYQVARMKVFNNTGRELKRCYAKALQFADDLYVNPKGGIGHVPLIPSLGNVHKPDRIRWSDEKYMNDKCEIEIPSKDAKYLDIADTLRTFHYNLCGEDAEANWMIGSPLHTIKVRIDYFNGTAEKFIIFEGYIYAANQQDAREAFVKDRRIKQQHEIIADQLTYMRMIFKEGTGRTIKIFEGI